MRRHFSTVDSKTGLELVLSEASYNMAMDWLEKECQKNDIEFSSVGEEYSPELKRNLRVVFTDRRTFYYDEDRGYLMGE